eukprot:scaffold7328_cov314-Pinguiococcus_pyrenoidosus.AAC.27
MVAEQARALVIVVRVGGQRALFGVALPSAPFDTLAKLVNAYSDGFRPRQDAPRQLLALVLSQICCAGFRPDPPQWPVRVSARLCPLEGRCRKARLDCDAPSEVDVPFPFRAQAQEAAKVFAPIVGIQLPAVWIGPSVKVEGATEKEVRHGASQRRDGLTEADSIRVGARGGRQRD